MRSNHSCVGLTVLQSPLCTKLGTVGCGSASLLARGFVTCGSTAAYHRGGLHSAEINYGASRQELMPVIKPIACSRRYSEKKKKKEKIFACRNLTRNNKKKYRKKIPPLFFFSFFWFHSIPYPPLRYFWGSVRSAEQWSVVWQVSPGGTAFKMSLCARKRRDWHLFPADILIHLSDEGIAVWEAREFAFGRYLWLKLLPGNRALGFGWVSWKKGSPVCYLWQSLLQDECLNVNYSICL